MKDGRKPEYPEKTLICDLCEMIKSDSVLVVLIYLFFAIVVVYLMAHLSEVTLKIAKYLQSLTIFVDKRKGLGRFSVIAKV